MEKLEETIPEVVSQMNDLLSKDAEMMEYYGTTFDSMQGKFDSYLIYLDYGIEKLQHMQDLSSLLGKENDYKWMNTILQAQYASATDRLNSSTQWYNTTKTEYDALYNRWVAEQSKTGAERISDEEMEMLETKLKVAREKMQEADS